MAAEYSNREIRFDRVQGPVRLLLGRCAAGAVTGYLKGALERFEFELGGNFILDAVQFRGGEFHDAVTDDTEQVLVVFVAVNVFVAGVAAVEDVFDEEPAFNEKLEGAVDRRLGDSLADAPCVDEKFFRIEVLMGAEDKPQYRLTFGRDFELFLFQISPEDI